MKHYIFALTLAVLASLVRPAESVAETKIQASVDASIFSEPALSYCKCGCADLPPSHHSHQS